MFRVLVSGLLLASAATAQEFVISTFAGAVLGTAKTAAVDAIIGPTEGVTTDNDGNVYFASLNSIFKIDSAGALTRIAGNLHANYSGDEGRAVDAQLFLAQNTVGIAIDSKGNVYVADSGNARVRRISKDGVCNELTVDIQ